MARANARFADMTPPFQPVIGRFDSAKAFIAETAPAFAGRELMIGATREEMHAFFAADPAMDDPDPAAVAERFAALAGDAGRIELYRQRRPGGTLRDLLADLVTDSVFLLPSLDLAEAVAERGRRVWAYQFDWAPAGSRFKACHCIELPFVFGTLGAWPGAQMLAGGDPAQMAALSAAVRRAWIAFIRDGDPAHETMPWPAYDRAGRQVMRFADVIGPVGDPAGAAWRPRPYA